MDITLFEIHLDGAQFGPATIGDEMMERMGKKSGTGEPAESEMVDESGESESGGRSRSPPRFLPVVVLLGIAVGYAVSRRFRGGDEGTMDVDAEAVEIEA
jgi:hypothetical protein